MRGYQVRRILDEGFEGLADEVSGPIEEQRALQGGVRECTYSKACHEDSDFPLFDAIVVAKCWERWAGVAHEFVCSLCSSDSSAV